MQRNEAIIRRIDEICRGCGTSVCEAALGGGRSPSALYDLIKGRTKCSKVAAIPAFCEGMGMTLSQFFDSPYFSDLGKE